MRANINLKELVVQKSQTLKEGMIQININQNGIIFVLDQSRLVGLMTDGDIRRALISGADLNDAIDLWMQKDFEVLNLNSKVEEFQERIHRGIKVIPIVASNGELIDYASEYRLHRIPLMQPSLSGNELNYLTQCITTGWISSQGGFINDFENRFSEYIGAKNSLAVSNGTIALHLALVSLGVGPGDEVIVPDLTFIAPVNAILYAGATPVLVDVDPITMLMNLDEVKKVIGPKTKAIIPVHLYGKPVDILGLMDIARKENILVVEDCAEAIGTQVGGVHVGNFGDASIFSFFANKTITTGEGGMVVFKREKDLSLAKKLRDHGMSPEKKYWHEEVGFNYRMTNMQAAIGTAQLERINEFVNSKIWIAEQYNKFFINQDRLRLPTTSGDGRHSFWLYTVQVTGINKSLRDELIKKLLEYGIEARPIFYPVHTMPPYEKFKVSSKACPGSTEASSSGICLPSWHGMQMSDIERVACVLNELIDKLPVVIHK